jgi:hypothetical protein
MFTNQELRLIARFIGNHVMTRDADVNLLLDSIYEKIASNLGVDALPDGSEAPPLTLSPFDNAQNYPGRHCVYIQNLEDGV